MSLKIICWGCARKYDVEERDDNQYRCPHCEFENYFDFREELKELLDR